MAVGGWRLVVIGGWRLVAVVGGWWRLEVGYWWLVGVGGWRLVVGGGWQRLAVGSWWHLAVGGWWRCWWRLAVGGWWSLGMVGFLKEPPPSCQPQQPDSGAMHWKQMPMKVEVEVEVEVEVSSRSPSGRVGVPGSRVGETPHHVQSQVVYYDALYNFRLLLRRCLNLVLALLQPGDKDRPNI